MMLHNKKRGVLLACVILLFSSMTFATNKVEKLAEYSAFEFLAELLNGSSATFKGKPVLLALEADTDNNLQLKTSKLVNNYTSVESTKFSLKNIVAPDTEYVLDVKTNDDFMYALLTNNDDAVREKKNLLLKSSDGQNWELDKPFPAEWELYGLDVNDKNISVSCVNCEDEPKLSYIVSTDLSKSWQKYSVPGDADSTYFSGIGNNRLFVVTENRHSSDREQLVRELMLRDLKDKKSVWVKADTSAVATLTREHNGKAISYQFDDLEVLLSTDEHLVATASYSTDAFEAQEAREASATWVSNDHGNTWRFLNLNNLANQDVLQFKKHGGNYHLVTNKNLSLSDLESDFDGLDPLGVMMLFFQEQQYSYYTLSKDDLDNTEKFSLEPKVTLKNGMGFNLDYKHTHKTSYVDTMFVHNDDNDLKLEFYRLHD